MDRLWRGEHESSVEGRAWIVCQAMHGTHLFGLAKWDSGGSCCQTLAEQMKSRRSLN